MISMKRLAGGAALTVLAMASASAVYAQETTGSIGGRVTGPNGAPLGNVAVVVTHVPSNTKVTTVTSADGYYAARNLRVGGPYTVAVSDPAHQGKVVDVADVGTGAPVSLDIALGNADNQVSQIVVTASASGARTLETGPRSTFTAKDIETLPSFSRDLKDLARLNPFVTIDPTNNNALIVAGSNNRVNTVYIDGVKQADDFGLNGNGYPSQRSPISLELVRSFNFEVAPLRRPVRLVPGRRDEHRHQVGRQQLPRLGLRRLRLLAHGWPPLPKRRRDPQLHRRAFRGQDLRRDLQRPDHQGPPVLLGRL